MNIPESQFGIKDSIAIFLSVILFFLFRVIIPEQRWITDSAEWLIIINLLISGGLTFLSWYALTKWLIPSNEELVDLDVKRRIDGGLKEIKQDAVEIQSLGNKIGGGYSDRVVSLGETIERIHAALVKPDLTLITQIEGKLFRFVNLLSVFVPYTLDPKTMGAKRTSKIVLEQLKEKFESALNLTIVAMDNMEQNLNNSDLSSLKVLEQTLNDLYQMDGLLTSRAQRDQIEEIKRSDNVQK